MKEQSDENFFVQIKDPNGIRRNILEVLKQILEILQRFEKFKKIRHEKIEKINQLRVLLRQTNKMLGDLRLKMPQTSLRATIVRQPQKEVNASSKKGKKGKHSVEKLEKAPKKDMTELEKLESQLTAIESKLKNLA